VRDLSPPEQPKYDRSLCHGCGTDGSADAKVPGCIPRRWVCVYMAPHSRLYCPGCWAKMSAKLPDGLEDRRS
jgi:hypothetical protein